MNETRNISRAADIYKAMLANRCRLCGKPIAMIYPEIAPGLRYARCQYGHKIRLEKEENLQKTAG